MRIYRVPRKDILKRLEGEVLYCETWLSNMRKLEGERNHESHFAEAALLRAKTKLRYLSKQRYFDFTEEELIKFFE